MKKIVTLDTVMLSLVNATAYGFGYSVPAALGLGTVLSIVICLVFGMLVSTVAEKIIFSNYVQQSSKRRNITFIVILLLFAAAFYLLTRFFAHSLWSDLGIDLVFSVAIPIVAFAASFVIRAFKQKKLRDKYGTGESGFQIDEKAEKALDAFKGTNAELSGYSGKYAVKTFGGIYIGKKDRYGVRFLGIPYAKSPVGENRWKKPVPVEASDKIFEAYYFGTCEMQPDSSHNILTRFPQSEDCLNLNICTAKLEPEAKKPVFVYIHGGDGRYGGSANPLYYLAELSKAIPDAVFVSFNYRFGVFGTIAFDSSICSDADEYKDSTVLPLFDQMEALKWIKANISAFGGDPDNITVAGDSMGGECITLLSSMAEARGLFRRALIICSSSSELPLDDTYASAAGKLLLEEFGTASVSGLKAVTSEQLRSFVGKYYEWFELPPRDGGHVPKDVCEAYKNGAASDIEFIYGIAADDVSGWQAMVAGDVSLDNMTETYYSALAELIGAEKIAELDALLEKYIQSGKNDLEAKRALLNDFFSKSCILHDCRSLTKGGSRVRCFYWDVKGNVEKLTSNTVSVVATILGNREAAEMMGYLVDNSLTEIMQALIGKYIHEKPVELFNNELKGVKKIVWDEFDPDENNVLLVRNGTVKMTDSAFSENVFELEKLVFGK
ncbi:MAG: carboxylesterase family protein [Lachnospiraceae bacterium]|nr:carboxylesterase family protein [Lachnospiraceae bacterium]